MPPFKIYIRDYLKEEWKDTFGASLLRLSHGQAVSSRSDPQRPLLVSGCFVVCGVKHEKHGLHLIVSLQFLLCKYELPVRFLHLCSHLSSILEDS